MITVSQRLAPRRGPNRSASSPGLVRRMTTAVAMIQAAMTASSAQACHQSIRPAAQNNATPITTSPIASRTK